LAVGDGAERIPIVAYHEEDDSDGDGESGWLSLGDGVGSGLEVGLEAGTGQFVQPGGGVSTAPGVGSPLGWGVGVGCPGNALAGSTVTAAGLLLVTALGSGAGLPVVTGAVVPVGLRSCRNNPPAA
jgi:hypothetical protein